MNRKFSKILGVGLTVALLASLLVMAVPASASALGWGEDTSVKYLKGNQDTKNILVTGADIVDLAVKGTTIYAATGAGDTSANYTYKSTDGGASWSSLYNTTYFPKKVVNKVAVAPDDANVVIILTSDFHIWYSSNGGSSWSDAGVPAAGANITDIDISGGTVKVIAAVGQTSSNTSELYVLSVTGVVASWSARYSNPGSRANQTNMFAVKFSPNYASDKIITVVSGNLTDNITYFQAFRNESTALRWNGSIATFTDSDPAWGTGIALTATLSTGIAAADIALVPTYLGSDGSTRDAFIALAGVTNQGRVIHLADTTETLLTVSGGSSSLAYNATSGALLAGSYTTNKVYRFLSPTATSPRSESIAALQQPSGQNSTQVAWVGDNAVAGTSGDESAFSISTDAGKTFNDAGLIDTTLAVISDVALNAAASKIYMTSYDGGDVSIWVKTTSWNRALSLRNYADNAGYKFLVRIAPENDAVAYVAAQGVASSTYDTMWVTKDSGATWRNVTNTKLTLIQDFAVHSADVVYAIDATGLSKTSDAGSAWGTKVVPATSISPFSITLATNSANTSDILIGTTDSYVAYSQDAGATLTRTQITTTSAVGNVVVVADKDYATNNYIYAAVGKYVVRGKADATSSFASRSPTFDSASSPVISGLVRDGSVIYAISNTNNLTNTTIVSSISQALNLTPTVTSSGLALWSTVLTSSLVAYKFDASPQALKLTSGGTLWTISSTSASPSAYTLLSYTNTNAVNPPTITAPSDNYTIPVNPVTGKAYNVTIIFNRDASDASSTYFDLQIATDSAFQGLAHTATYTDVDEATEARVITASDILMPELTYYWRMRVAAGGATLQSPWTPARTLSIAKVAPETIVVTPAPVTPVVTPEVPKIPAILTPAYAAADVSLTPVFSWTAVKGAINYELAIAKNAAFTIPGWTPSAQKTTFYAAEHELEYGTAYFWRVRAVFVAKPFSASDWVVGIFTTKAAPVPPPAEKYTCPVDGLVFDTQQELAAHYAEFHAPKPAPPPAPPAIPQYLLWTIIIIGAVLIIALIILIVRTRRVA